MVQAGAAGLVRPGGRAARAVPVRAGRTDAKGPRADPTSPQPRVAVVSTDRGDLGAIRPLGDAAGLEAEAVGDTTEDLLRDGLVERDPIPVAAMQDARLRLRRRGRAAWNGLRGGRGGRLPTGPCRRRSSRRSPARSLARIEDPPQRDLLGGDLLEVRCDRRRHRAGRDAVALLGCSSRSQDSSARLETVRKQRQAAEVRLAVRGRPDGARVVCCGALQRLQIGSSVQRMDLPAGVACPRRTAGIGAMTTLATCSPCRGAASGAPSRGPARCWRRRGSKPPPRLRDPAAAAWRRSGASGGVSRSRRRIVTAGCRGPRHSRRRRGRDRRTLGSRCPTSRGGC